MGVTTGIEWTDATWNPWTGCTKISPACAHCYMFTGMKRYGKDPTVLRRSNPSTFRLPMTVGRDGYAKIRDGSKVFTCSWSDWFHEVADPWRGDAWEIIRHRRNVIFQIVTKRTDRIRDHLPDNWGSGWPNVWLIATAENQEYFDRRWADLSQIPAVVRGLSIEPLLGPISLDHAVKPDWIIVGGESGSEARPMHPTWVRSLRDQASQSGIPFFFKQWGEWLPPGHGGKVSGDRTAVMTIGGDGRPKYPGDMNLAEFDFVTLKRVGKNGAGRTLDGREWSEFPAVSVGL